MPLAEYDRHFGGKKGAAEKAFRGMVDQYGEKKGRQVFYSLLSKRRKQGKGRGLAHRIRHRD